MLKRMLFSMILCIVVVTLAVMTVSINRVWAQGERRIIPATRDILVETVDPATKMPKSTFCIGINSIDVKLTNNSGYRRYVYVIDRDTRGMEQTLYTGWLEPGASYLSALMRTQLEVTGPAGTETLRVDVGEAGQNMPGRWVTFYVQDCGGYPPGGEYGNAVVSAQIYPYAIPRGGKGTITLQTNVDSQANMIYYFEILNSYGQLWKRLPVSKRPYEQYQITLTVGKTTKLGMLTYTVKLWQESGFAGGRRPVATTQFSFRVVTPGSAPMPYDSGYQEYPATPYEQPGYWPPSWYPYSGGESYSGNPYSPVAPYTLPSYGAYPETGYQFGTPNERSTERSIE